MLGRLAVALAALVLVPATAHAAVVGGSASDPQGDTTAGPGTDIVRAGWSFDPEAGRASVTLTFAAVPTSDDWGAMNASLRDNTAAGCGGAVFLVLRGGNKPGDTSASASVGNYDDGQQPDGSTGPSMATATNVKSDEGRTSTMEVTHARLVGRTAACMTITLSRNGVKDSVAVPVDGPPPPVEPKPTPPPGPGTGPAPPADPKAVRLASGRRIRFLRGSARLTLTGVAERMTGRVRLATRSGLTITTARWTATSSNPLKLKLFPTRRGGAHLRRHRSTTATLTLTTKLQTTAVRRYSVRVRS